MSNPWEIPEGTTCKDCRVRLATIVWAQSVTDVVHGSGEYLCEIDVLSRQIIFAETVIADLDAKKQRRAELLAAEAPDE